MYTLRFPFQLPAGQKIAVNETAGELDGLRYRFEERDSHYVLTVVGFQTVEAAKDYLKNVRAGLMWVLLHTGVSAKAAFDAQDAQEVTYFDDPQQAAENLSKVFGVTIDGPVDALLDGGHPAVYATGKQIRIIAGGQGSILVTTPGETVLRHFAESAGFEASAKVVTDQKLLVALELYAAYFTESSGNARFLTLIMALEALATGAPRTQRVLDLLDKWRKEADELLKSVDPNSDDAHSLQAVSRELLFRREDSIRGQVRNLVATTLSMNGGADAAETAKRAVQVYDLRSTLVHEGKLNEHELSTAISEARSIVERVLRARFFLTAVPTAG